ncbi:Guanine nucleotide-binding protein G(t) subunit alpha-2 [Physocladia obscura]|uniref:Guanine nucleotide-binding protein G(T) subunit alpha-2 n=1 Tax=Physocladia obscura TaxID=109957 RepID=A0AAD5T6T8_9FUNG|nr:Guanine nucleotide-binding protein G(t) subunit alpha-2 [Physocladia obscura]
MGNVCSGSKEEVVASAAVIANSKEIDKQLKKEEEANLDTAKLLLLGTGETGKSTILKQMRLINGVAFTEDEYIGFRSAIFMNVVTCAKSLIHAMDTLKIPYGFQPPSPPPAQLQQRQLLLPSGSQHGTANGTESATNSSPPSHASIQLPAVVSAVTALQHAVSPSENSENGTMENVKTRTAATDDSNTGENEKSEISNSTDMKKIDPTAIIARQAYANIDPEKGQQGPMVDAATVIRAVNIRFGFVKGETLPPNIIDAVRVIWKDSGIQYCYTRANEYQLIDCCSYFLNDLDRICSAEYMPTEQDILNARMMTTSITETKFEVQGVTFRVFDVGGQRSQRKKWAPYFDDVRAIIFLVAMNSYDQVCFEDSSANRMVESLNVFKSMCNHPMFKSTAVILFMNKIDLFRTKLETAMIANHFPEFQGDKKDA